MNQVTIQYKACESHSVNSALSAEERDRAAAMHTQSRAAFIAGRALLRQHLAELLGCPPEQVPLVRLPSGKLSLQGYDSGPWFSLSHTYIEGVSHVVVASADGGPCGVDIENPSRQVDWRRIARRRFHPMEWQRLERLEDGDGQALFTRLWTVKESLVKIQDGQLMAFLRQQVLQEDGDVRVQGCTVQTFAMPGPFIIGAVAAGEADFVLIQA